MSTRIGDMAIYISANTAGLARDLTRASALATSFAAGTARRMADAGRSIASVFRDVGAVAGGNLLSDGLKQAAGSIGGLVKSSLDLAGAAEVAAGQFETILGSAKEAAALLSDLRSFAANSPVSVSDAQQQATRLLAAGVSREQVTPTIGRLSDLSMGDPNKLRDLTVAYSQVMTTGRLQGDEWNQIANIGTLGFGDLAKVLKVDTDQVKKLIETGRVGFYDLQRAIKAATDEGGRFAGLGAKYAGTYLGKLDKLDDAWQDLKREFGQALIEEWGLKGAADDVTNFAENLKGFVGVLRPAMRFVGDLGKGLAQLGAEGGKGFFVVADVALGKLNQRFPETIRWIKDGVTALKEFKLDPDGIEAFADKFGDGLTSAIRRVQPYWDKFAGAVGGVVDKLGKVVDWLDRPTNVHVRAAMTFGEYSTLRAGDAAREELAKAERDVRNSMNHYGLSMADASSLVRLQGISQDFLRQQREAEEWMKVEEQSRAAYRMRTDATPYQKEAMEAYSGGRIAALRRDSEMSAGARANADREVAAILARADPSLTPAGIEAAKRKRADDREAESRWKAEQAIFDAANAPPRPDFLPVAPKLDPRLSELAGRLNEQFVDPLKKIADDMADLNALRAVGRIDERVYGLAAADAAKDVGLGLAAQLSPVAELGSQALASMVGRAAQGNGPQSVEGLLRQIADYQRQTADAAKQTATNTGQPPPTMTMPE